LTPSLYGGRRKLCGGLSEFDRQLFFKTALIALERAVMQHIQHLSFESLVKMDHFQKERRIEFFSRNLKRGL
jgi:hypothetical protein